MKNNNTFKTKPFKTIAQVLCFNFMILQTTSAIREEFPLIDQERTEVDVAKNGMNRLSIKDDRILKIVISDDRLQWELDEENGQLFFKVLSKDESPISLTLLTEKGLTHDVTLVPQDCEAKTIVFEPKLVNEEDDEEGGEGDRIEPARANRFSKGGDQNLGDFKGSSDAYTDQLTSLMHAMVNQTKIPGFHATSYYWSDREYKTRKLNIKPLKIYKNAAFEGKVYELKNVGSDPVILREKDFSKPSDCAIAFSKDYLEKGDTLTLYVISRKV